MTKKQALQFNRMLGALKVINKTFMTPNQIRKHLDSGLEFEEELEMAYENIQQFAKQTIKGVRPIKNI